MGSCRREILDHVIPLNEEHLRRLLRDFVNYYHQYRVHDFPGKGRAEWEAGRAEASKERNRRFIAASGRVAPSLLLACRCVIVI